MELRKAITVLLLSSGIPLSGQGSGEELWRSMVAAAAAMKDKGQFGESERMLRSALEEARQLEPNLAPLATTYHNLAGLYQDMGRCDPAVAAYQRSVELWEKTGARGEAYLLQTANHLVGLYLVCGATQDADRHFRTLIAPRIAARTGRDRDPDVAEALANLGSIEYQRHRYSEARSHYEEALAMQERISAEPSAEMGILLSNLAFSLLRTGEVEQALAHSRRAIAMLESTAGPSSLLLVSALVNGADLNMMARRWAEAEPLLDRALTILRNVVGEEHLMTATAMACYAALLRGSHRKKEAAVVESRVREIRMTLLHSAGRQTVDVRELSGLK